MRIPTDYRTTAAGHRKNAVAIREKAASTDDVLSGLVSRLGSTLFVKRGRLMVTSDRGEESFWDLSDGERSEIAVIVFARRASRRSIHRIKETMQPTPIAADVQQDVTAKMVEAVEQYLAAQEEQRVAEEHFKAARDRIGQLANELGLCGGDDPIEFIVGDRIVGVSEPEGKRFKVTVEPVTVLVPAKQATPLEVWE